MTSKATFGAGCFWGVEAEFRKIEGVTRTTVGYAGGGVENPTYEQVCTDRTGHAEVVEVEFDPEKVDYRYLVDVFFKIHDPTQVNRQGPDVGTQYRSVVFTHDEEQAIAAKESLEAAQERLPRPVATQIESAPPFWPAEDYHQRYLEKRGLASCAVTVQD